MLALLCTAQMGNIMHGADRGIDTLIRNVFMILAFSGAGETWSVDARLKGAWSRDDILIAAWPRYFIVLQLVMMYFAAGVQKVGLVWTSFWHYSALYVILQNWAYANADYSWIAHQPWFFFSQVSTAVTVYWQILFPLVLLFYWCEARPGRMGDWANRYHLHLPFVAIGMFFHFGIAATMALGIFPWAMLAGYIAFLKPVELQAIRERLWRG